MNDAKSLNVYYNDNKFRILISGLPQFSDYADIQRLIKPTDYLFIVHHWYTDEFTDPFLKQMQKDKLWFLCNCKEELSVYHKLNRNAIFCHNNVFHDERIFVLQQLKKVYDAILISNPVWYKRLELASEVENLVYLSADWNKYGTVIPKKVLHYKARYDFLPAIEVNRMCNQSKVGLILSDIEGGSFATIEYLLSGIPVVSTPNKGGRNVFLNEYNSIEAEPNPIAVRNAAIKLINDNKDANKIRQDCINIMMEHRQKFISLTQCIMDKENITINAAEYFSKKFFHKMTAEFRPTNKIIQEMES